MVFTAQKEKRYEPIAFVCKGFWLSAVWPYPDSPKKVVHLNENDNRPFLNAKAANFHIFFFVFLRSFLYTPINLLYILAGSQLLIVVDFSIFLELGTLYNTPNGKCFTKSIQSISTSQAL